MAQLLYNAVQVEAALANQIFLESSAILVKLDIITIHIAIVRQRTYLIFYIFLVKLI